MDTDFKGQTFENQVLGSASATWAGMILTSDVSVGRRWTIVWLLFAVS
jgi:hypothetical protein